MITPKEFSKAFLHSEYYKWGLWFQQIVKKAPSTAGFDASRQCFSIPQSGVLRALASEYGGVCVDARTMLKDFGWTTSYIEDDYGCNRAVDGKVLFHWTNEEVNTTENKANYERKYKYVTFNDVMWDYGHTDMSAFDEWFNKVAEQHMTNMSNTELIYSNLLIPLDDIPHDFTYVNKGIGTNELKNCYEEHLKFANWSVSYSYVDPMYIDDDKYYLVCCY